MMQSTDKSDKRQADWVISYMEGHTIVSDFNSISRFYALGGQNPTYLPPFSGEAYSKKSNSKRLIEIYYANPASAHNVSDAYIINKGLTQYGMHHLGSLLTRPNPKLSSQLDRSTKWNRVYHSGTESTYVTG
jgi:hypothetical protein